LTGFHSAAALDIEEQRKRVVVIGAHEDAIPPVLAWIEHVMPVRFQSVGAGDLSKVEGALVLDPARLADAPAGVPRLVLAAPIQGHERSGVVALRDDSRLPRPLRGRKIADSSTSGELPLIPTGAHDVLASAEDKPVWWQAQEAPASLHYSAYPLPALEPGGTLREHLCAGSFMGLLPLLLLLTGLLGEENWRLPAARAAFVIDDPNLHLSSYGFMKYPELVAHASSHGYHLGFATVPLDGWWAQRRAAALVRDNPSALSLLIHGNDHVARELGRLSEDRQAEPAMAQALRRITALERRSGVPVARVMAPPHGVCSEAALRAMFRLGFEAVCISRPYPWRDGLAAPNPLAGWHPAELVAGGIPVAPRQHLAAPTDDLPFRALLGHPLILYGHHGDFAQGLEPLAQAAAAVNSMGDVSWGNLGEVSAGAHATRRVGETLLVRMYARRTTVQVPEGVSTLRVLAQEPLGGAAWKSVSHPGGTAPMSFGEGVGTTAPLPVTSADTLQLELVANNPLDPMKVAAPGLRPWPLIRRVLVEGRDRVQPLL
jgi:hypothetical protein